MNDGALHAQVRGVLVHFGLLLCALCVLCGKAFAVEADTVFINGKIVTVDDRFTIAHALAIKDGRILSVDRKSTRLNSSHT